jgi:tryptophanyl-tRNA synthetase
LNCQTPFPMLANAHSFKDKSDRLSDINAGLFTYPVLQAADIVLYKANFVPVGKDQRQHLEMSKDIAASFNRTYGEVLILPEALIDENVMVIPGTDGTKMSKSYNNFIDIFLPEKQLLKQIKSIISDSTPLEAPKNPDIDITFKLFSLVAEPNQIEEMRQNYLNGGFGYGHAKQALFEILWKKFEKEREIFNFYMEHNDALEEKLRLGEAKAKDIAENTIYEVRGVLGYL